MQQLTPSGCWLHYLQVWIFHDDIREGTLRLNKLWHSLIWPQKQASEGSSVATKTALGLVVKQEFLVLFWVKVLEGEKNKKLSSPLH